MKIDFLFIDEIGISLDPNQPCFGVGGLRIENTININRELHNVFTGAVSFLNQKEERFEFKFKYVTYRSLRFYKRIIDILKETPDWNFKSIFEEKKSPWGKTTFWKQYLEYIDSLVKKFPKRDLVLVSDYLTKPKKEENDLFDVIEKEPHILNILQLESQGSLLLQVSDILLGVLFIKKEFKMA